MTMITSTLWCGNAHSTNTASHGDSQLREIISEAVGLKVQNSSTELIEALSTFESIQNKGGNR